MACGCVSAVVDVVEISVVLLLLLIAGIVFDDDDDGADDDEAKEVGFVC